MELLVAFILARFISCRGYDDLSSGGNTAQSTTWDCPQGSATCTYQSKSAVDGDINTCARTEWFGQGESIPHKTAWWHVDLGNIKSVYSITIQFEDQGTEYETRQRGRMAGFSLFISNSTKIQDGFLCYKNGQDLPSLLFIKTCINHGQYVIYYNERLPGVLYPTSYENMSLTQLCNVKVMGCKKTGFYGPACNMNCPENCQEKKCNIVDGTCLGCTAGWIGKFCNESCPTGSFGIECKSNCSSNCKDNLCSRMSGECNKGCKAGWMGSHCDEACLNGKFGPNCVYACSNHCLNTSSCNVITGQCQSCKPGYTGLFCNDLCTSGSYGHNCSEICSPHCLDNECHHVSGHCMRGCDDGYQGKKCTEVCNSGRYGKNCSKECNGNCINKSCNHMDGTCTKGCNPGWLGFRCDQVCPSHKYGNNCSSSCNNNCRQKLCHHVEGVCLQGCVNGFQGPTCIQKCNEGWFGRNCSEECNSNCINNKCHHIEGTCKDGCTPGWIGSHCSEVCGKGTYGHNCSEKCSQFCKVKTECDPVGGRCSIGCEDGYIGLKCNKHCQEGFFGENCSMQCSANCVNLSCNHRDGRCRYGCKPGWIGSNCSEACANGSYGQNCSSICFNCLQYECNRFNGTCKQGCVGGYLGEMCDQSCTWGWFGRNCSESCNENCKNQSCDNRYGTCTSGCKPGWRGSNCSEGSVDKFVASNPDSETAGSGLIGGLLATCLILLAVIIISTVFIIRRKRHMKDKSVADRVLFTADVNSNESRGLEMNEIENPDLCMQTTREEDTCAVSPSKNTLNVSDLPKIIKYMSENGENSFKKEYMEIPKGEMHPCDEGKKPTNVSKNRYTTTFPYDHSRVILETSNSKESDYINANYIENVKGTRSYIATQGPKPKTIADFWKMVWQENVAIIVCLTNLKEGAKTKCALYWPNTNDKIQSGNICVRHQDEKIYASYTVRKLKIQNMSDNSERNVLMFHYTQWPDHGVPEPLSLVVFHRQVMKMSEIYHGKYILVHCSAGIGRTGTYIALDALYRQAEDTGETNVQKYLETMRKDRMNMIQGEEQYKTVYLALLESFRGKPRPISTERYLEVFQEQSCYMNLGDVANKSTLSAEFEELLLVKKEYTDKDYEFGRKNEAANLNPNVLPVEEYTCQILNSKGIRTYYNAVVLQSFTRTDCLISAQFPLPDYVEDFLRLVRGFYTAIIVSLCPLREFPSSSYWIPTKKQNKTIGEFTTKFSECTEMANFNKTNIVLHYKEGSAVSLSILESNTWKGENDTSGRRVLLDLIKEAQMEENTHPGARILVLSSDGAKRCGQFCVVYNALEQLTMDKEVDIFTITRLLQIRRSEFISNLEDYQFCYDAAADYLQNDTVYANC